MSKRNRRKAKGNLAAIKPDQKMQAFTFGEPSAVLDRRDILDYTECVGNGNGLSRPSAFPGWQKPARRRAPQLTHLREAP